MIATHELVGMRDSLVRVARKDARTHTLQWKEVCTCPEAAALCLFMHCRRRHQVQPPRYHAFIVLRATAAHTNTHNYTLLMMEPQCLGSMQDPALGPNKSDQPRFNLSRS